MSNSSERIGLTPDKKYWLSKRPGSSNWHRTWFDHGSRQTLRASLGTPDFEPAYEKLIVWWAENRTLVKLPPESVTLSTLLLRYYQSYAKGLKSETQIRISCSKVIAHSGKLMLSELSPTKQRELISHLFEQGYGTGYVRRIMGVLKAALRWAWKEEMIASVPNIILPAEGSARGRTLTHEELVSIVDNSKSEDHLYRFVILAIATWARPEAILELDRDRCDTQRRLIDLNPHGRPQNKKYRPTIPMVDAALHVVEDVPQGRIVTWQNKGVASIKTAWRRLRKRAGLDDGVIPYLIRHTLATEARGNGCPPWEIEGWLGHKRPGTSERYAKFSPNYLSETAKFVDEYMRRLPLRA